MFLQTARFLMKSAAAAARGDALAPAVAHLAPLALVDRAAGRVLPSARPLVLGVDPRRTLTSPDVLVALFEVRVVLFSFILSCRFSILKLRGGRRRRDDELTRVRPSALTPPRCYSPVVGCAQVRATALVAIAASRLDALTGR